MIGRYVKIEPLDPPLYLSLCEVIIRGHIYNRNLTALSGNFRATRHRQLSLKIPPGFGVHCTDLNFSATTMWAPAEIFPDLWKQNHQHPKMLTIFRRAKASNENVPFFVAF